MAGGGVVTGGAASGSFVGAIGDGAGWVIGSNHPSRMGPNGIVGSNRRSQEWCRDVGEEGLAVGRHGYIFREDVRAWMDPVHCDRQVVQQLAMRRSNHSALVEVEKRGMRW